MIKYEKIFLSEEYLVINKPAGLLSHGAPHIKEESLVEELLRDFPALAKIGDDPGRPGLMHRLDKMASGLMVIALTTASFDNLKKQFRDRSVNKIYTALVYGKIARDEGEINFPIQRSSQGHKMAALPKTYKGEAVSDGRTAITEFDVIKRYINYTLLKVKIKTGRTHQIRVHMCAYGYPLVGDDLYGTSKTKRQNIKLASWLKVPDLEENRIFLVADELEFTDLSGQRQKFTIPLPENLQTLLNNIK